MGDFNTTIQLNIRVKDIKEHHFFTNRECPIDLALMRAGYPNLKDKGLGLMNNKYYITPINIKGYVRLQKTMTDTYKKLMRGELIKYPIKATLELNL